MEILKAEKISKSYDTLNDSQLVLNAIDLSIYQGEFVSVMGSSGSGKSTLMNCLSGIDQVNNGSIYFKDQNMSQLSADELADLRRIKMGFVFQQATFLPYPNILDNIILPSTLRIQTTQKELLKRARELMGKTGISDLANRSISEVSGGQLQRAGICRALLHHPEILFADEPTGALNSQTAKEIMGILRDINEIEHTTILLVTHEALIASMTERVLLMHDGQIREDISLGKYNSDKTEERLQKINNKLIELKI